MIKGKDKSEEKETGKKRNFPLVMDFNPALPPVGRFIAKHKHILELDPKISEVIPPSNVFTSYRGNKTLKEMLAPSKLCPLNIVHSPPNSSSDTDDMVAILGCYKCPKLCKFCKLYLVECKQFTSYHTEQIFNIKYDLSCDSKWVIYLINDLICERSYVGSTEILCKERWANHKSHIRHELETCELTKHFKVEHENHVFSRKCKLSQFDKTLTEHLEIRIIDYVENADTDKLKKREAFWQSQLRTFVEYGGLNKRDSRLESSKSYLKPT